MNAELQISVLFFFIAAPRTKESPEILGGSKVVPCRLTVSHSLSSLSIERESESESESESETETERKRERKEKKERQEYQRAEERRHKDSRRNVIRKDH